MYLPSGFQEQDQESLLQLMRDYPFATLLTQTQEGPYINHLPILAERRGPDQMVLIGHMARANPQWKQFESGEVRVVFQGPHTYITPQWYPDPLNVPTWNYAVVHAAGTVKVIDDLDGIESILRKTVAEFERHEPTPWKYDLPDEFRSGLVRAIVGFEIQVSRLEGKFKLSQNRTEAERQGVLEGLKTRKDEMSLKTLDLMRSLLV